MGHCANFLACALPMETGKRILQSSGVVLCLYAHYCHSAIAFGLSAQYLLGVEMWYCLHARNWSRERLHHFALHLKKDTSEEGGNCRKALCLLGYYSSHRTIRHVYADSTPWQENQREPWPAGFEMGWRIFEVKFLREFPRLHSSKSIFLHNRLSLRGKSKFNGVMQTHKSLTVRLVAMLDKVHLTCPCDLFPA